jgi:hypothetical protein
MERTEPASGIKVTGTGEFERDGLHVIATVQIDFGVIRGVGFATDDGQVPPGADEVESLVVDKPVSSALEVTSSSDFFSDANVGQEGREVLLEAFYRAVEACLDQQ